MLAGLLVSVMLPAQAVDASAPKLAEYEKLVADWTAAQKASQAALKELVATEEYKAAVAAKDNKKITELRASVAADSKPLGARAIALADQHKGDVSLQVLAYAAKNFGDADTANGVAERIEKNHLKDAALAQLLENAGGLSRGLGPDATNKLLDRVIATSPHALPKAWAMFSQAQMLLGVTNKKDASDADKAAAAEKAARLLKAAEPLAAGNALADRVVPMLFEAEHLQIGMAVPDIVGEDVDGVAFKLSDYRGKVVVLDYWGFW
ncbi:MAG TPA: hypothetical protein VFD82_04080 [Planctomycetota bacterium]|nr:hypothetical protein [Planctomycetota bacterium]